MKNSEIFITIIGSLKGPIADVYCKDVVIYNGQSALDFMINVCYEADTEKLIINKEMIAEDFFDLESGLAGEVLEKSANYQIKIAVYGDFSKYDRQSFRDFAAEKNRGKDFFFAKTKEEAVHKLESI
ncbi:MAG: DUF4180 domain-containing protein [Gallicola sp.]|nr:DUF4180 domain-containing protein [Gallicola sp.]